MKKKPRDHSDLTLPELGKALSERWKLSQRYHVGELDVLRSARAKVSGMNWRILRYQRIIEPDKSFLPVSSFAYVTPKTFERHLAQLQRECNVMPLEDLLGAVQEKREIPEKTVAITIDGGSMDTFLYAFPIIKASHVPVSVFLPTAFIDTDGMFWSDKVILALLTLKAAGEKIEPFEFFSQPHKDAFAEISPDGEISFQLISLMISGLREADPNLRQLALSLLGQLFTERNGLIPKEPYFMTWEEAVMMENFGVRFGSYGHRAAAYHELSPQEAKKDVQQSFEVLKARLQNPLRLLAAPEGILSLDLIRILHDEECSGCLLLDRTPDNFVFLENFYGLRRISVYEAMTKTPELFFCKLWDIPHETFL